MATTYVSDGERLTVTAPAVVTANQIVVVGTNLVGVALNSAASASPVTISTQGVWELPAAVTNTAAVVGQFATYDTTANAISVTAPTTGYVKVGVFTRAKLTTEATVQVRLNGAF